MRAISAGAWGTKPNIELIGIASEQVEAGGKKKKTKPFDDRSLTLCPKPSKSDGFQNSDCSGF